MFAKRLLQKVAQAPPFQHYVPQGILTSTDLDPCLVLHYGIPPTASILAFDPIQHLLAVGTLDGRIKVIGGDNIEGLLISPNRSPFKNLEFLHNQGLLVSVSNENDVQVWDLEHRCLASSVLWESNITAFSVIYGTNYMYIGDEHGLLSVLKYDTEEHKLLHLPYHVRADSIAAAGISLPDHLSVVGTLPQPHSQGNRVLIAYENGLIILWDISKDQVVLVRGYNDLQLKDEAILDSADDVRIELSDHTADYEHAVKEISSLCWVSQDGSLLAVGYVDGDIILWQLPTAVSTRDQPAEKAAHDVVKLQLSSATKRLPVIVLHWSANMSHNDHKGQLFVYGGDDIGSEEVITILSLHWGSDMEALKCIGRVDLRLNGSFADIILLPNAGATESSEATSFLVLTNPGQLHFYDDAYLSASISQQEKSPSVPAMQFPMVIPVVEPLMTVGKLSLVNRDRKLSRALLEAVSAAKLQGARNNSQMGMKWPFTGGVPCQISSAEDDGIKRVYIAGYQDGSVRMWDATYPTLSLIFILGSEVKGIKIAGASESISALEFCSFTLNLAIGNESGQVRLCKLIGNSGEMSLHHVTETGHEVCKLDQGIGSHWTAVYSLLESPVCTLQFADFGNKLAVGFECGRVAMLDICSLSVMFVTDCVSSSISPIISMAVHILEDTHSQTNSPNSPESISLNNPGKWAIFILTNDAHFSLMDASTGNMISSSMHLKNDSVAISMHILEGVSSEVIGEKHSLNSSHKSELIIEPVQTNSVPESNLVGIERDTSTSIETISGQRLMDLTVLLCCEDALCLYSLKSLIQGKCDSTQKVNLVKPCSWTATFQKDQRDCGLVVLYQTGVIEIRSVPDLEVVVECSLMSILRWNFKNNMDKMMSSSYNGQIALVNGFEYAIISLLAHENDFRIPESLPCLHDKVLAAVVFSADQNKKQGTNPGFLGGIIKGFKGGKMEHNEDLTEAHKTYFAHLESIFSRSPGTTKNVADGPEVVELNIDDIDIDEPVSTTSSSHKSKSDGRDKEMERKKLLEGATAETKPRLRSPAEIIAKYRKAGDASEVAAHAREKLVQRQEKLERISRRTEELQSGAENFASMASELAKRMENRKWWQI
ncbi:uncharacterized protein LOC131165686 isoform X2 [Malania oleifera]|uniref:uncharacterized protein LOC131165686 isoform X2 n=1 Tax=Malania oleifera TaxID=397392 RepID=UPI0025ADBA0F|nr:uncharacterized protein LOC131165686 isoform X2 [Malania oleifera]